MKELAEGQSNVSQRRFSSVAVATDEATSTESDDRSA
jgi:hypothetical protein